MGAGASAGPNSPDNLTEPESVLALTRLGTRQGDHHCGDGYYIEAPKCIDEGLHVEVSKFDAAVVALPRGGVLVNYGKGTIQFGLPPETIKDSLMWGLNVPTTFVILGEEMFDRQLGINIAEFEFPAYFNFFVFNKRVTLITTQNVENRVRRIFQETLLGPKPKSYDLSQDFASDLPGGDLNKNNQATHWPNFTLEGLALDKQRETITVDALLNFENIDKRYSAFNGGGGTGLHDTGSATGLVKTARIPRLNDLGKVMLDEESNTYVKYNPMLRKYVVREGKRTIAQVDHNFLKPRIKAQRSIQHEPFDVPLFGVTMLGASHGFDPKGTTTGFVVWVNRRGIMVDPPPDSAEVLRDLAISSRLIDGMILTHCHADHDAGAFQKILHETSIKIYTTQTIMDSFIRKYSAISNLDANFLRGLFVFERVKIGETKIIHNAEWSFHYSLHVIPTIGFEVKFMGEGLVYSGDTCTNFRLFEKMRKEKKIGIGRYEDLVKHSPVSRQRPARKLADGSVIPAYRPFILHEAGVPPIHTPLETLARLSSEVRDRLFVVHVDEKQLNEGKFAKKLRTIPQWSTLRIDVASYVPESDETTNSLAALLSTVSSFRMIRTAANLSALLEICRVNFYNKGTVILKTGETWNRAYIVRAGVALELASHDGRSVSMAEASVTRTSMETGNYDSRRKMIESSSKKIGLAGDKIIEEVNAEDGDEEPNTTLETGSMKRQDSSIARNNDTRSVSDSNVGNLVPSNGRSHDAHRAATHKPTKYIVGDMFGEQSVLVEKKQDGDNLKRFDMMRKVQHDIVALTDLYTVELPREELLPFFETSEIGQTILESLNTVARFRAMETWALLRLNNTLEKSLNRVQQQEFQKLLSAPRKLSRYEVIFSGGIRQEFMYLVSSGIINLFCKIDSENVESGLNTSREEVDNMDFHPGALIGDVNRLTENSVAHHVLTAKTTAIVYEIPRMSMVNFLNRFPGVKLQCIDRKYIV